MQLSVGQIVEGKITGITNFGVFVDLGEQKTGMVHISEVAKTYVNEIRDFVKENDVVKMKVLSIGDDGKVSLSIKRAAEPRPAEREPRQPRVAAATASSGASYGWVQKKAEPVTFEEMMNRFKQTSEEKFSDLKRKNPEAKRQKRGAR